MREKKRLGIMRVQTESKPGGGKREATPPEGGLHYYL